MRFRTWIPVFFMLQFSLCGQEDPVIPDPGLLTVVAEDEAGASIPDARITLNGIAQVAGPPSTFEVEADAAQLVSVDKTGWIFAPADTSVTLAEAEELELVFRGENVLPGRLTVRAVDGDFEPLPGVTVIVDGEAQAGSAPVTITRNPNVPITVSAAKSSWAFTPADTSVVLAPDSENEIVFRGELLRHLVLLEDFSNILCLPCPAADAAMWEAVGLATSPAVPIAWHPNFPSPSDPFFLYSPAMNNVRYASFYGIFSLPNVRVDGIAVSTPSNSGVILAAIEARLQVPPSLVMQVLRAQDGAAVTVSVTGKVLREVPEGDWRIYLGLLETLVHYEGAPNGQTEYRNTVRHATGEGSPVLGEAIDLPTGAEFVKEVTFTPDFGVVVAENLRAFVFVQNSNTFEILDAAVEVSGGP